MKAPALPDVPMIEARQVYLALGFVGLCWLIDIIVSQQRARRACAHAFQSGLQMGLSAVPIEDNPVPKKRKARREPTS